MTKFTVKPDIKWVWPVILILILIIILLAIEPRFSQLSNLATDEEILTGQLRPIDEQTLLELGITKRGYSAFFTALEISAALAGLVIGGLILIKGPNNLMSTLFGLAVIAFPLGTTPFLSGLVYFNPGWDGFLQFITSVSISTFIAAFLLFPDGKFQPKLTPYLFVIWTIYSIVSFSFPILRIQPSLIWRTAREGLIILWVLIFLLIVFGLQFYRYRNISNYEQRQQTKWVVFGGGFGLFIAISAGLATIAAPLLSLGLTDIWRIRLVGFSITLIIIHFLSFVIAVALLRSNLFDIDLLIRRTLKYSILSLSLLLIYALSITLIQGIINQVSFERNPSQITIAVSTLLIAALFNPLRHRVQTLIDRRFYRQKYDAAQMLARFAQTAQDEVDMDILSGELVTIIQETMEPESTTLWINQKEGIG
jgi:hypothetical protein